MYYIESDVIRLQNFRNFGYSTTKNFEIGNFGMLKIKAEANEACLSRLEACSSLLQDPKASLNSVTK